jgi:hexaprenyl-diphosphate synthase
MPFISISGRILILCRFLQARDLVNKSSGPAQTAALAEAHAQLARDALKGLPESEAREALEGLTRTVLNRTK